MQNKASQGRNSNGRGWSLLVCMSCFQAISNFAANGFDMREALGTMGACMRQAAKSN
jgi:hypothetical protein